MPTSTPTSTPMTALPTTKVAATTQPRPTPAPQPQPQSRRQSRPSRHDELVDETFKASEKSPFRCNFVFSSYWYVASASDVSQRIWVDFSLGISGVALHQSSVAAVSEPVAPVVNFAFANFKPKRLKCCPAGPTNYCNLGSQDPVIPPLRCWRAHSLYSSPSF